MKKVVLSIAMAAFLCLGLTSCDKETRKCYKFSYEIEILGAKTQITTYEWCSANEADAKKEALQEDLDVKVSRSIASEHKTSEDCVAANIKK